MAARKHVLLSIPLVDIGENVPERVEEILMTHTHIRDAVTIPGIMVEGFNVKLKDVDSPGAQWKPEHSKLYKKIESYLKNLLEEGKVKTKKSGPSRVYWWVGDVPAVQTSSGEHVMPDFETNPETGPVSVVPKKKRFKPSPKSKKKGFSWFE